MICSLDHNDHFPRFSAPCPICGEHSFIVFVEPADYSVGKMGATIADVGIEDDDETALRPEYDHLSMVLDTLYGDDDDAALALEKTLFAASRH